MNVISMQAFRERRNEEERARRMEEVHNFAARVDCEWMDAFPGSDPGLAAARRAFLDGVHAMCREAAADYGPPRDLPESERREYLSMGLR